MSDLSEELIELQIRLAYQEDTIAQLNQVVTRQDADIILLKQQMALFAKRLEESAQVRDADQGVDSERPPHY